MYFTDILQTAFDLPRAYLSVHVPYLYRVAERTLHGLPRPTARYLPHWESNVSMPRLQGVSWRRSFRDF